MKVLAQQNGLMATFMAKWSNDYPGQSGHIHLSLRHSEDSAKGSGSAFMTVANSTILAPSRDNLSPDSKGLCHNSSA